MVEWIESVDSTNRLARCRAGRGAGHGTAIAAHVQTAGRGRLGRVWSSIPGNLHLSVVLRRPWTGLELPWVTLASGVAVIDAIGGAFRLKWPNDLLDQEDRKLGGILAEAEWRSGVLDYVVVGVGMNVAGHPPGLDATCLWDHGLSPNLERLAQRIADSLSQLELTDVAQSWTDRSCTLGREVSVGAVTGTAVGLDHDGALLVKTGGRVRRVVSGDLGFIDHTG